MIETRSGDVRLKFDGDVKWQKAAKGESLVYNDTVFAGAGSEAKLKLGASDLQVTQNTLVVLRRQDNARFLNLNYGKLLGHIAKNDKIVIDTGDGRHAILSSKNGSEIRLEKKNGKTEVKVMSGEAELVSHNGVKQKLNAASAPTVANKEPAPPPPPKPVALSIRAVQPKAADVFYSKDPLAVKFEWQYVGKPSIDAKDRFTIEFSKTADFQKLLATKTVDGRAKEDVNVRNSFESFYRVRGPKNELSQVEKLKFIRMLAPEILNPVKESVFLTDRKTPADIEVRYKEVPGQPHYWMQVASDQEFKTVLLNESKPDLKTVLNLPAGVYFLRARSDFGSERLSDWSPAVPFQVKEKAERLALPKIAFENSVVIPNKAYPENLYHASKQDVQKYLSGSEGFMQGYFGSLKDQADEVMLDPLDGTKPKTTAYNWPADKIYPGQHTYRYQLLKRGKKPSPWSAHEKLNIALEPPKQTSLSADVTKPTADGRVPVRVKFTPLLFASRYEVQLAHSSTFSDAKSMKVATPQMGFFAKENSSYYWRARALDEKGKPISEFSTSQALNARAAIMQARQDQIKSRAPAATNTISMAQSSLSRTFEPHHGYWMWFGSGVNFTSYTQSIQGVGTFDSHDIQPMGAYVELGFGDGTWGGVFSYKNAPGSIQLSNATVNNPNFSWQTFGAEALYCPIEPQTLFGNPVMIGLRGGLQYHSMPFATVASNSTQLNATTINMLNASLGATAEWSRHNWRYYWTMRYQYPLSAGGSGTTITPTVAFDGSLGTAYYFTKNWKAGLFWYGQWQQFQFDTTLGGSLSSGSQMLFYSAMDLRLGYDF